MDPYRSHLGVKLVLTHNEGIKTFDVIVQQLRLRVERKEANRTNALVAQGGQCKS